MWLAQLGAFGLLRASFVPPEPVRDLRDLTRGRSIAIRDRTREIQRLEKFLEGSGIKLSAVVSDLTGISSRAMLDALIAGERSPDVLASLAKGSLRRKIPELVEALNGRFKDHHAFMARIHLEQIDARTTVINQLTARIEELMAPFRVARQFLATIPGVSTTVAEIIIAETGADMSVFETPGRLVSWAGVCPGSNESAGRVKSAHILPGNKYLKGALGVNAGRQGVSFQQAATLGIAAMSAARSKGTYLSVRHRRIAARRGPMKAIVATEHSILAVAWHLLAEGEIYQDPGPDHFTRLNPDKARNSALSKLRSLGYDVTLTPTRAA